MLKTFLSSIKKSNIMKLFLYIHLIFICTLLPFYAGLTYANPRIPVVIKSEQNISPHNNSWTKEVSSLVVPFIENKGQVNERVVKFYAHTFAGMVFVTDKGEIIYHLTRFQGNTGNKDIKHNYLRKPNSLSLKELFDGPEDAHITGISKSPTIVNYFKGPRNNWKTNIPAWDTISLGEMFEGIEITLIAHGNTIEKIFTLLPGSNVQDLIIKVEGAEKLSISKEGILEIETELGTVKMTKPVAYQDVNGERVQVAANYIIPDSKPKRPGSQLAYSIQVGNYDKAKPLIIDPVLSSTFMGGSKSDYSSSIALDSSGNVFVSGYTNSSDFPVTTGSHIGSHDVFISKLDNSLSNLLSSTYIGGNSNDYGNDLILDAWDNVYIAGMTNSNDYPTTSGAYNASYKGGLDAFVSKLNNSLSTLLSSTYLGGANEDDSALALTLYAGGNVYVTGQTLSNDFPVTAGAYDKSCGTLSSPCGFFDDDVFISKFDSSLTNLLASTFLGGSYTEISYGIDLDSQGNVFIAGKTVSSDFPTTIGAYDDKCGVDVDGNCNGTSDAFIAKLNSTLSSLLASTFIGGSSEDYGYSLAVDALDNVFVTGGTKSNDFPSTSGAYNEYFSSGVDVFVSKLDNSLATLQASTFIGGSAGDDQARVLALDSEGNIFISGKTGSTNFPTTLDAFDRTLGTGGPWNNDAFVSKVSSDLGSLLSSTYIGGSNHDYGYDLAVDTEFLDNIFITGPTYSSDYPSTSNAYERTHNTGADVFVSKLDSDLCVNPPVRVVGATTSYYDSIQTAYNASEDDDTIQSRDRVFVEELQINIEKSVILKGGYNCTYTDQTGNTIISGIMTLSSGDVTIENFVIE